MWQLLNRTPFAAERRWLRDRQGAEVWIVAVKASFDIVGGRTQPASRQPPVLDLPEPVGRPGGSSLRYDADLILTKTCTDVTVVGHAWAPAGRVVDRQDVAFRVGPVHKALRVFGDRQWGLFGATAPRPFEKMPLVYERASGGPVASAAHDDEGDADARNPVGAGHARSAREAKGMRLPNIEWPQAPILSWRDRPAPAGFGSIACHWQPRVGFAGTYDEAWRRTRQPLWALDLDERYFQSAPLDQQCPGFLRGGEPVALRGLSPAGPLDFVLPTVHLGFETRFFDGTRVIHPNRRLHSVILEPDLPRVSLVWHSALPCHDRVHQLEHTVVTLKTGRARQDVPA